MSKETGPGFSLFRQIDLLVMMSSIVLLFVALGTEPWWTLSGATNSRLFSIQISPFLLHINAVGIPTTTSLATSLGYVTRTLLLVGFVALFAASLRPKVWWRNLALSFGFATLLELYLSFLLMFYWAETMFVSSYGAAPPFYGTANFQAIVIGLDYAYYPRPLVTATFTLPYYIGFLSIALILGQIASRMIRDRALQVLKFLLPGGGIHDVYLTPPYNMAWFSSTNRDFNPMAEDLDTMTDDQLLVSFQRLYDTVEPGGNLSIVIPAWATTVSDRFQKLMPLTGFTVESEEKISDDGGEPETELHFHRPEEDQTPTDTSKEAAEPAPQPVEISLPPVETLAPATPSAIPEISPLPTGTLAPATSQTIEEKISQPEIEPAQETAQKPAWTLAKMTHQEHEILKAAVDVISQHRDPVPYRELLNQVYMELVNKQAEFDSARQIEAVLLDHNGREVQVVDEADDEEARIIRKWMLGTEKLAKEGRRLSDLKNVKPKLRMRNVFRKSTGSYHAKKTGSDEETAQPSQ